MPISESDQKAFERLRKIINERAPSYETGVQTTIIGQHPDGWRNLLTKLDFGCKGRSIPQPVDYRYPDLVIVRRLVKTPEVLHILEKVVCEGVLDSGTEPDYVPMQTQLNQIEPHRRWRREWSEWPGDIVYLNDSSRNVQAPQTSLIAIDAPYYPSLDQALFDLLGFRPHNASSYLDGKVILVVPDFRARISKLTLGRDYLRGELDCVFSQPSQLVAKIYAENSNRRLAQESVQLTDPLVELNLDDQATFASIALLYKPTGELLHEKSFDERRGWIDKEVIFKASEQEIEQMILLGETETVEFKRSVERVKIAKEIVAFANTHGGTITVGVEDDGRVVGCDPSDLADTVANIVHDRCDPPPAVTTEFVEYKGKTLLLIRVEESKGQIHFAKDHGPYIRVNGTTRIPTSYEHEHLIQRRNGIASAGFNYLS